MTPRKKTAKREILTARTTAVEDLGLPAGVAAPENPSSPPRGLWVRTTCHIPWGGDRGTIHYVNPDLPDVKRALEHLRIVPLPGQDWNYNDLQEGPS